MKMRNASIRAALPQIFRRPLFYVSPSDTILHAATFLAVGPQVYIDGLVILDSGNLVGRLSGWSVESRLLRQMEKWLDGFVYDIMDEVRKPLDADMPLYDAMEALVKTRFAFMPVAINGNVVASLSVRDLLGMVDNRREIARVASPVTVIDENMGLVDALRFMDERGMRNLVTTRSDGPYVINDRKILEFLISHEARQLLERKGFSALRRVPLSHIGFHKGKAISPKSSARGAAKLLSETFAPCLFVGNRILTPWDLVVD